VPYTSSCSQTQTSSQPGFSVCSKSAPGPLDGIFKAALGKMLASKDWYQASQNLSTLQKQSLSSALPERPAAPSRLGQSDQAAELKSKVNRTSNQELRLQSDQLPRVLNLLSQAGVREDQLQHLAAETRQENGSFDLKDLLARAQKLLTGESANSTASNTNASQESSQATAGTDQSSGTNSQAASDLAQMLQIPAVQLPQWQNLLVEAGMPADQVQDFFGGGNPNRNLSLQDLTAWLTGTGSSTASAPAADKLTALSQDPQFTQSLERLAIPQSLLPQLRSLLQQAGISPEVLKSLSDLPTDDHGGVKLADVLAALKGSQPSSTSPGKLPTPDQQVSSEDLAEWRQLFIDAGLDAAQADELTNALTPGSGQKFLQSLASLTPTAVSPAAATATTTTKPEFPVSPNLLDFPTPNRPTPFSLGSSQSSEPQLGSGQDHPAQPDLGFAGNQNQTDRYSGPNPPGVPGMVPPFSNPATAGETAGISVDQTWSAMRGQLQQGILAAAQSGASQLRLALNPPSLGQLQVNLMLKGDVLQATVVTANNSVAAAVNNNFGDLQQALAQHGLNLQNVQVVMASTSLGQQNSTNWKNFSQDRSGDQKGRATGVYRKDQGQSAVKDQVGAVNSYA